MSDSDDDQPMSYAVQVVVTWVGVVVILGLLFAFPHEAAWLFAPLRDHLSATQ